MKSEDIRVGATMTVADRVFMIREVTRTGRAENGTLILTLSLDAVLITPEPALEQDK